jgi:hypothetical protein
MIVVNFSDMEGTLVSSGTLTAGNANAIAFAAINPAGAVRFATKVVIDVTTPGGTAGSLLQVGLADAADGTNIGTEFFPAAGLDLNTAAINDSWNTTDTGVQVKFVVWAASGADSYIVGKILTQNAASLAGKYYIYSVPR